MIKRVTSLILATVVLLMILSGCSDKEQSIKEAVLSGAEVTVNAGERVAVPVTLSNMNSLREFCNGRLAGFQFNVSVTGLNVIGAETNLSNVNGMTNWTVDDSAQSDGSHMIMIMDMNLVGIESSGNVEIAQLYLEAPADASGEYTVNYTVTDVCDTDANSAITDKITVQPSKVIVE